MQKNKLLIKIIKWVVSFIFSFIVFQYIFIHIEPFLIFHLQQPPFYTNKVFFAQYFDYPGGISELFANFLAQSFYSNWWGSVVIFLFLISIGLTTKIAVTKTTENNTGFFWMFIPSLLIISLLQNYYLPFSILIKIGSVFYFFAVYLYLKRYINEIAIFLVLSILLYYVSGTIVFIVFSGCILIHYWYTTKKNLILMMLRTIVHIALTYVIPLIGFYYIFNISRHKLWFDIIPDLPTVLRYIPDKTLYIVLITLPTILLITVTYSFIVKYFQKKFDKLKSFSDKTLIIAQWLVLIAGTVIIFLGYKIYIEPKTDNHRKNIILTDYFVYHKNYEKAIQSALKIEEYDLYANYNYNRAIFNLNRWGIDFFKFPQLLGSDGLFPDKIVSGQITIPAMEFYYELGYISEALHWAYEAQSLTPYNPRVLKQLVKVHLIENRTQAAATYLNVLNNNLLNKDFVKKYSAYLTDTSLINKDEEFLRLRQLMPTNVNTPVSAVNRFEFLLQVNKTNQRALEFLAMSYLLQHQLGNFAKLLPKLAEYHKSLPSIYEQALLLYNLRADKPIPYPFKEETIQQTKQFFEIMKKYSDKNVAKNILFSSHGGTYLYYLNFQSPIVTKMQLKAKEIEKY